MEVALTDDFIVYNNCTTFRSVCMFLDVITSLSRHDKSSFYNVIVFFLVSVSVEV